MLKAMSTHCLRNRLHLPLGPQASLIAMIYGLIFQASVWAAFFCLPYSAFADTLPAVRLVNGTPIDPASADVYYNSVQTTPNNHTYGLCNMNSAFCNAPRPIPIIELANTLSNGGKLNASQYAENVFEYVYKNIDIEFRYGLSKGAFGALLDGSGTPFDQANLMVELLRQGGVAASYQTGTVSLTPAQAQAWTGITNATALCQYLANGAIPAIVNGSSNCSTASGPVSSVIIAHIWVSANGILYDPSFKTYIQKPGIGVAEAMGCGLAAGATCGSTALSVAIPASSQGYDYKAQANYVQDVQYKALGNTLNGFALNLQRNIQNNYPSASIQDIVGGQIIDPGAVPTPNSNLPYGVVNLQHTWSGDIPDQYRSRMTIQFLGLNATVFADETAGYWLHIGADTASFYSVTNSLIFERERNSIFPASSSGNEMYILASGTGSPAPQSSPFPTVTLSVSHPYASANGSYMNQTFSKSIPYLSNCEFTNNNFQCTATPNFLNLAPIYIVQAWGRTGRGTSERYAKMAAGKMPNLAAGASPVSNYGYQTLMRQTQTGVQVLTTITSAHTVASWLGQAGLAVAITDALNQTRTQEQHTIGFIEESVINNVPGALGLDAVSNMSVVSLTNSTPAILASFSTHSATYNALEGSAFEQANNSPYAGSSVRNFELTNETGNIFYQANAQNLASIETQLSNWINISNFPTYGLQFVSNYIANAPANTTMIITKSGSTGAFSSNSYTSGAGSTTKFTNILAFAPALAFSSDGFQIAYVMTDGYKGANIAVNIADPAGQAMANINAVKPTKPLQFGVDLRGGDLTITPTPDLTVGAGSFPASLSFQRYYNSANSIQPDCISIPWTVAVSGVFSTNSVLYGLGCMYLPWERLGQGWTDNWDIRATIGNDGFRALGSDSALDAVSTIAALKTLSTLPQSPAFTNYLAQAFVAAWLTDSIASNSVSVTRPPESEVFIRLADGTFNPRPGKPGTVINVSPVSYMNGYRLSFDYKSITFSVIGKEGDSLSFQSAYPYTLNNENNSGDSFLPVSWSFPSGIKLQFKYISDPEGGAGGGSGNNPSANAFVDTYELASVSNSLGHRLTFSAISPTQANSATTYTYNGLTVTDETGRSVKVQTALAPGLPQFGQPSATALTHSYPFSSMQVVEPDGATSLVNYGPMTVNGQVDFQDLRVSSVFLPANPSTPYLSATYDNLFRTKTLTDANGNVTSYFPGQVSFEKSARGIMIDPLGNDTVEYFDGFGHQVKMIDPLGRVSARAYDDIGRLTLSANPLMGCNAPSFDVRGNQTQNIIYPAGSCVIGDPGNGQIVALIGNPGAPISVSTSYGITPDGPTNIICVNFVTCNEPFSQTDERGNVTNYTWNSSTGQLTQVLKPADENGIRPEFDLSYTMYTGIDGSLISFLSSKKVKISSSVSQTTQYTYNANSNWTLQTATVDPGGLNLRKCFKFDAMGHLVSTTDPRAASCP